MNFCIAVSLFVVAVFSFGGCAALKVLLSESPQCSLKVLIAFISSFFICLYCSHLILLLRNSKEKRASRTAGVIPGCIARRVWRKAILRQGVLAFSRSIRSLRQLPVLTSYRRIRLCIC